MLQIHLDKSGKVEDSSCFGGSKSLFSVSGPLAKGIDFFLHDSIFVEKTSV